MKIGIDARFFGSKQKGLGVYMEKLVENLQKTPGNQEHEFYIFLRQESLEDFKPKSKNFHKVLADFSWYGWKEQFFYPFFLNKYQLDVMHFGHFNVPVLYFRKFVVTIHDLILFHYPTCKGSQLNIIYYYFKLLIYRLVIKSAILRSCRIIAISKHTKKDLILTLKAPKNKIEVIYQGCNFLAKNNKQKAETILKKYGILKPYLIYFGNVYPHKNLARLIEVFSDFRKKYSDYKLVLAGGEDYFQRKLKEKVKTENHRNIIFPGFIEDSDMGCLYKNSEFVVYPSLYEGFGFPPLEALAHGKQVACSNRTSMPEILGEEVCYFDPKDSNSMLNCLNEILEKKPKRQFQDKNIKEIIAKFNWSKTAQQTLTVYQSVSKQTK